MNAVDGKLWVESLLEEVGKSAWFAFSKKRERLDSSLEVELGDDKRGSTLSSWNPATRARIVSSRAFWETARWAFAHLERLKPESGSWSPTCAAPSNLRRLLPSRWWSAPPPCPPLLGRSWFQKGWAKDPQTPLMLEHMTRGAPEKKNNLAYC